MCVATLAIGGFQETISFPPVEQPRPRLEWGNETINVMPIALQVHGNSWRVFYCGYARMGRKYKRQRKKAPTRLPRQNRSQGSEQHCRACLGYRRMLGEQSSRGREQPSRRAAHSNSAKKNHGITHLSLQCSRRWRAFYCGDLGLRYWSGVKCRINPPPPCSMAYPWGCWPAGHRTLRNAVSHLQETGWHAGRVSGEP
jgi:hypothetical protein